MLTETERREVEAELHHHPSRRAGCVEALKIIQKHRRWVPDDALVDLAGLLEMSPADLEGVATFFNLIFRKPVGRNVILLCDSVSCWLLGYEQIQAHLKRRLGIDFGETTADGRFTLLPNQCLGCCDRGPALILGEELHTHLTPDSVDRILDGGE